MSKRFKGEGLEGRGEREADREIYRIGGEGESSMFGPVGRFDLVGWDR